MQTLGIDPEKETRVLKERRIDRLTERLFGGFESVGFESARAHLWFEGCGLGAKCGTRGRRPQRQWRLGRRVAVSYAGLL